jgi:hypothetical protein
MHYGANFCSGKSEGMRKLNLMNPPADEGLLFLVQMALKGERGLLTGMSIFSSAAIMTTLKKFREACTGLDNRS